ncbi:DUF6281 family protein [Streptomyces sp. 142MFCol3.1]|uniref:DUF6281 family protein n=1 Tax=Streptomyces sp. 142MFCol3.1 TaxID=1172179 RepID=UPI0004275DBF|nr:DUF6281 family protein [Streptomyces sp. 142MFCol3.1]
MTFLFPTARTAAVWTLPAAVLAALCVACTSSSGDDGTEGASSCAALVQYQDRTYTGTEVGNFRIGDALGAATLPPCDDTGDLDHATPTPTTAYAIEGVDPAVAVALEHSPDGVVYVNTASGRRLPEIKKMIKGS